MSNWHRGGWLIWHMMYEPSDVIYEDVFLSHGWNLSWTDSSTSLRLWCLWNVFTSDWRMWMMNEASDFGASLVSSLLEIRSTNTPGTDDWIALLIAIDKNPKVSLRNSSTPDSYLDVFMTCDERVQMNCMSDVDISYTSWPHTESLSHIRYTKWPCKMSNKYLCPCTLS